jgi:REP element-mobilizing transposase RayT
MRHKPAYVVNHTTRDVGGRCSGLGGVIWRQHTHSPELVRFCLHESSCPHDHPWPFSPRDPARESSRGNFFEDGDQQIDCDMLAEQLRKFSVEVWAYCLMPNHVHLILTPQGADGMSRALEKRIAGIPTLPMRVVDGPVIYFRAGSRRSPWTSHTWGPRYRRDKGTDGQCVREMIFCVHEPQYVARDPSFGTYSVQKFYLRHTAGLPPTKAIRR